MNIGKCSLMVLLLVSVGLSGQVDDSEGEPQSGSNNLKDILPPLSLLIDSAIANSPEMKMSDASLVKSEYQIQINHNDWSDLLSVNGRYSYGQFVAGEELGLSLSEPRGGYQVFAGFRLPLNYFIGRSKRLGMLEADMEIQQQIKVRTAMNVEEEVIEAYNDLLLLQKLLNISAEARESSMLQYKMAEERFREGNLSLEELGKATDMRAGFTSEYEKLKSQFANAYSRLERLVGTPFSNFPKD